MPHSRIDSALVLVLLSPCVLLAACQRETDAPITGKVTLKYAGNSAGTHYLELVNASSRAIEFEGSRNEWIPASYWTPNYSTQCTVGNTSSLALGPLIDPPPDYDDIEVASGETVRLALPDDFLRHSKGIRCTYSLRLTDYSEIESEEFEPAISSP
jgi:hypothetical protein